MEFEGFKIAAYPFITDAFCKCGDKCIEVSNGWFSRALYCPKCENVYQIKMIKVPEKKLSKDFMEQCRIQAKKNKR